MLGGDGLLGFVDMELHAVEFEQQVVGEFDVGLVDLVDEDDGGGVRVEGVPELAADDVVGDVGDAGVTELAVPQAGDGVVFVEALLGLGGGFDVPFDEAVAEAGGDLLREDGLAGAGLALDEERALEGDGGVDGDFEVAGGDVVRCALEAGHAWSSCCVGPGYHGSGWDAKGWGLAD